MKNAMEMYQVLGQYESIWNEFEGNTLKQEILSEELKKDSKRSIREIKNVVKRRAAIKKSMFFVSEAKAFIGLIIFVMTSILLIYIMSK